MTKAGTDTLLILTPLREFERQFLVNFSERHNEDQVDDGCGTGSDHHSLTAQVIVLEKRNGDENSVHDHSYDKYDD